MTRTVGSVGAKTEAAIRAAALKLIAAHGYELMSLRQVAAEVGVQAGAIYRYFPSKTHMLCALIEGHIEELRQGWERARPATDDPVSLLKAFIDFHIRMHAGREKEIFVADRELRSLPEADYNRMAQLLKGYENLLTEILVAGKTSGAFSLDDPQVATYAYLAMMTGVCHWFRDGGRISKDQVVAYYTKLVLNGAMANRSALAAE